MRTERMFLIWSNFKVLFSAGNTSLSLPSVVFLLNAPQRFIICSSFFVSELLVSYVGFALFLSMICCLGKVVLRDWGISWITSCI